MRTGRRRVTGLHAMSRPSALRARGLRDQPRSEGDPQGSVKRPTKDAAIAAMMRYCVDGDASAFAALYEIAAPRLFGYVLFLVRDRALAEELLQQTFLKLHQSRGSYVAGADPIPWLHVIAHRTCIDELRRAKRTRCTVSRDPGGATEAPAALDGAAEHSQPAYGERTIAAVLRALDRLPERHRLAVVLTKIQGNTIEEAAAILGTTPAAVKLRAHRGYTRLRQILLEEAGEP
jgi:RNA polymerase sigma-70 factor (ECF subfamily)